MLIPPEEGLLGSVAEVRILSSSRWSVHSELLRIIHPDGESTAAANSLTSVPEAVEHSAAAAPEAESSAEAAQPNISAPQQAEIGRAAEPAGVCSTYGADTMRPGTEAALGHSSIELRPPAPSGATAQTSSSGGSGGDAASAARNGGGCSSIEQAQMSGESLQPVAAAKTHEPAVTARTSLACPSIPGAGSGGAWGHVQLIDVLLCAGAAVGLSGVLLSGLLTLLSAQ